MKQSFIWRSSPNWGNDIRNARAGPGSVLGGRIHNHNPHSNSKQRQPAANHITMGDQSPRPKLASGMRPSPFPFPRRPSASPHTLSDCARRLSSRGHGATKLPAELVRVSPRRELRREERLSPSSFPRGPTGSPSTAGHRSPHALDAPSRHSPFSSPSVFPPTSNPLRERHHVMCASRAMRGFPADVPCGCRRARLSTITLSWIHFRLKQTHAHKHKIKGECSRGGGAAAGSSLLCSGSRTSC